VCREGYFEAFRAVLTGYGVPEALYAGRTGVYFVNTKKLENWPVDNKWEIGEMIDERNAAKTLFFWQFPAG
jgi:hypothetical protein